MSIDFTLPESFARLQAQVRDFVAAQVIPLETDPRQGAHGPEEALRRELVERARSAGLLSPHAAVEYGDLGLSHRGRAVVFEEAGYSLLGPVALNVFAPDEGNMHLLEAGATEAQKERWLRPLVAGDIRSCFCMTEPPPGAGSDPSMLQTQAVADGDHYVISGQKWFTTGADGAALAIVMAIGAGVRRDDVPGRDGVAPASRSSATWTPWIPASPVDTAWSGSRACACRRLTSSASSAKVFVMPRFACLRRG